MKSFVFLFLMTLMILMALITLSYKTKNGKHCSPFYSIEKLKSILQTEYIKINPIVTDITKVKVQQEYDLINLSNILIYV